MTGRIEELAVALEGRALWLADRALRRTDESARETPEWNAAQALREMRDALMEIDEMAEYPNNVRMRAREALSVEQPHDQR